MEILKYLVLGFGILCYSNATAQGLFDSSSSQTSEESNQHKIELNGYARGSAFGGAKDFDYSSVFGEFCLQGKWSGDKTFLFSDFRIRGGLNLGEEYTTFQLKEAYAGYTTDKLDVFLGNQIVTWGRADGFNPTNNITPNNYFFLSAEPDDQKLSNFMLRAKYRFSNKTELDLIGIPFYVPSVYRYDLFNLGQGVKFASETLPKKSFKNGSIAARFNVELSKIGFSVSLFRGFDPFHGYDVKQIDWSTDSPTITNSATPYLKSTIGADFSIPIGTWITRGELAYDFTRDYETKIYIPNPSLAYVAGVEHNFGGFVAIMQYIGKYVTDFTALLEPVLSDPLNPSAQVQYAENLIRYNSALFNRNIFNQQEGLNHALSLTINRSFLYDTWSAEFTGYYNITSKEYLIRPKITWKITDALSVSTGGSYMDGLDKSVFGYSGPVLNGVFLELKANF